MERGKAMEFRVDGKAGHVEKQQDAGCANPSAVQGGLETPEAAFARVVALAKRRRMQIEGGEILHSEDQAGEDALVSIDKWLFVRHGAIRMQVRVLARESTEDEWDCVDEGRYSAALTVDQALQMVEHWYELDRQAVRRAQEWQEHSRHLIEAFGPRIKLKA